MDREVLRCVQRMAARVKVNSLWVDIPFPLLRPSADYSCSRALGTTISIEPYESASSSTIFKRPF